MCKIILRSALCLFSVLSLDAYAVGGAGMIHSSFSQEPRDDDDCRADLSIKFFSPPMVISKGGNIVYVSDITTNSGGNTSPETKVRYYISDESPVEITKSNYLGERVLERLTPGEDNESTYPQTFLIPASRPASAYYFAVCVDPDNNIKESEEDNNCRGAGDDGHVVIYTASVDCQGGVIKKLVPEIREIVYPPSKTKTVDNLAKALYFIKQKDTKCAIHRLDIKTDKISVIYTPDVCPDQFLMPKPDYFVLVHKKRLQTVWLKPKLRPTPWIDLPVPALKPKTSGPRVTQVAYNKKGELSLVMSASYPWYENHEHLFRYRSKKWREVDNKRCGRSVSCGYEALRWKPVKAHFRGEALTAWHEKQADNPYLVKKKSVFYRERYEDLSQAGITAELTFKIGNKTSVLTVGTIPSSHSDSRLTMGVSLKVEGKGKDVISEGQCETMLMGRYLIVQEFFTDNNFLYDLATGEKMANIHLSRWAY